MIQLTGITWDHARGYDPLLAVDHAYKAVQPDVHIHWDRRSLKDFGDYPVALLAEKYDLLIVDHPFMAQAYENGVLIDLCRHISAQDMRERQLASVGPSHQSYEYQGTYQALAIDAAAQVAAGRNDLLHELGHDLPRSFTEVLELGEHLPCGKSIASTMAPTDIFSTFLGLCAQIAGKDFFDIESGFDPQIGAESVELIQQLYARCHPDSLTMNPIQMLDRMSQENDIVYCAYLYGYTNYSRNQYRKHIVNFSNAPLIHNAKASSLLGGTGIAVSVHCSHPDEAAQYIKYITSSEIQTGIYARHGGQPADLHAWNNVGNNNTCHQFFINTLQTLENAYVRPKVASWNDFQEKGGNMLNEAVKQAKPSRTIAVQLRDLYCTLHAQAQHHQH